jgi:hypothetical protein
MRGLQGEMFPGLRASRSIRASVTGLASSLDSSC